MSIEYGGGQSDVSWIPFNDEAVRDEIGGTTAQADFVAIKSVSTILDNDICVRLKNRDDLVERAE
jgi:hypothetical protein